MKAVIDVGYGLLTVVGVAVFRATGRTPGFAYTAMRRLTAHGRRGFLHSIDRILSSPFVATDDTRGIGQDEIEEAVASLERDGFYVFSQQLPDHLTEQLTEFAHTQPCKPISDRSTAERPIVIDDAQQSSPRCDFSERDLVKNGAVRELLCDRSLREIAGKYLRARPLVDIVSMWWSFGVGGQADSAAAQMFHCDRDRLSFVKLFVYLSDVDEQSGPHVFGRRSHKRTLPAPLRRDTRYSDAEVQATLGDQLVSIAGPKGMLFMADTSAVHKGAPVLRGRRLVFQIEWTGNLFGAPYEGHDVATLDPALRDVLALDLRT